MIIDLWSVMVNKYASVVDNDGLFVVGRDRSMMVVN